MAGNKRKQSTNEQHGKRSSPRKSARQRSDDISDYEHLQNVVDVNKRASQRRVFSKVSPTIESDHVEFPLSNLTEHLMCKLCGGYYRDCHTIVDCLHSFCRSCLTLFLKKGQKHCPTCDTQLGPHPFKRHTSISTIQILPDRTMQEIVDKMLPSFKEEEIKKEREFYSQRDIKLKAEYRQLENGDHLERKQKNQSSQSSHVSLSNANTKLLSAAAEAFMNDNIIELRLIPDTSSRLPALNNPQLRTSGKLKIITLKRYVLRGLNTKGKQNKWKTKSKNNLDTIHSIEILCNGHPMGNEMTLTFIYRTMWLFTKPQEALTLTYSFNDERLHTCLYISSV